MSTNIRDPQAPESYATFWEPIALNTPHAPVGSDPKDAYLDFVSITEDVSASLQVEQIDI